MIRGWRAGIGLLLCLVIAAGSAGAVGYSDGGAGGQGIGYDGGTAADARPAGFSPSPSAGRRGGSGSCTPSPGTGIGTPTPIPFPTLPRDRFHYLTPQPPVLFTPEIPTINLPTINYMDLLTPRPAR